MLDQLIEYLPLDQRGRPVWLPDQPPQDGDLRKVWRLEQMKVIPEEPTERPGLRCTSELP